MPKTLHPMMGLKTRILILVSLLIIAGVWGLAAVVATALQTDLKEIVAQQLSGTVDYVASEIDHEIQFRTHALNKLAADISPEIQADPTRLQHLLKQSGLAGMLFSEGIMCTDSQGVIFADSPAIGGRTGGSLKDREYFREIMAGAEWAISGPVLGRFVKQPIIAQAVPLHDDHGTTTGALVGSSVLSDHDLFGLIETTRIGKTGYFLVVSPKDRLIVSATEKSRILTPLPARGVNPVSDRRLDEGFDGVGIAVNSKGRETLTVSRRVQNTGWIVVGGISTEEAFAPITRLRNQVYLGALLISLLVALVLRLVLKRQLAPLQDAAVAMRRMSEGTQPLAAIPIVRADEIGQLVGNFNRLVTERKRLDEDLHGEIAQRRHREDEVRHLNENLELRVTERTNELLLAKQKLEQEIAERRIAESSALDYATRLQIMTRRHAGAQESERRRLARELHDRVSSSLTAIGLSLGLIERQLPRDAAEVRERLTNTLALVKDTMLNAREISHDLHPSVLEYGGVMPALEDYGRKFSGHTGIAVEVTGHDREIRLPPEAEIALYRIAQEALTNCAKHAEATTITIALDGDAEHAVFVIADDGVGFDLTSLTDGENKPGLGLLSMRERASAIGGKLTVESAPGSGTRIIVEI